MMKPVSVLLCTLLISVCVAGFSFRHSTHQPTTTKPKCSECKPDDDDDDEANCVQDDGTICDDCDVDSGVCVDADAADNNQQHTDEASCSECNEDCEDEETGDSCDGCVVVDGACVDEDEPKQPERPEQPEPEQPEQPEQPVAPGASISSSWATTNGGTLGFVMAVPGKDKEEKERYFAFSTNDVLQPNKVEKNTDHYVTVPATSDDDDDEVMEKLTICEKPDSLTQNFGCRFVEEQRNAANPLTNWAAVQITDSRLDCRVLGDFDVSYNIESFWSTQTTRAKFTMKPELKIQICGAETDGCISLSVEHLAWNVAGYWTVSDTNFGTGRDKGSLVTTTPSVSSKGSDDDDVIAIGLWTGSIIIPIDYIMGLVQKNFAGAYICS